MKTLSNLIIMMLTTLSGLAQQNQTDMINMMSEKREIQDVVTNIFVGTDERNWPQVKYAFAKEVVLDYTSMAGGGPSKLSPQQIIDSWKAILPGFEHTQHTISNFNIQVKESEAEVYHYGNAQHYLKVEDGEDLWTVVGTYDHHLTKTSNGWKVDRMRFNLKYMNGNMDLPRLAKEKVEESN